LGVQAKAITLVAAERWNGGFEDDNPKHEQAFIEPVCAFVGITPVPLLVDGAQPRLPRPVEENDPDPILSAIEQHRRAWSAFCDSQLDDEPRSIGPSLGATRGVTGNAV